LTLTLTRCEVTHYQAWFKSTKKLISVGDHIIAGALDVGKVLGIHHAGAPLDQFYVAYKAFASGVYRKPSNLDVFPPLVVDTSALKTSVSFSLLDAVSLIALMPEIGLTNAVASMQEMSRFFILE